MALPFLYWQVFSVSKSQWVRVVFAGTNLHPQVCPIDFSSAPRVGRDDGDGVLNTETAAVNIDTTVTIVTLWKPVSG